MSIENSTLQHTEQVLLTLSLLQNSFVLQNEQRQYVTTNHCSSLLVALWSESGTHWLDVCGGTYPIYLGNMLKQSHALDTWILCSTSLAKTLIHHKEHVEPLWVWMVCFASILLFVSIPLHLKTLQAAIYPFSLDGKCFSIGNGWLSCVVLQ
jgi:hypothetical protein